MLYGREPFAIFRKVDAKLRRLYWKYQLAQMGARTTIHPGVVILYPKNVSFGADCAVASFVHIWGGAGVTIGDDVLIASHVAITSQTHDATADSRGVTFRSTHESREVVIEKNVWIGSGAVILPGVRIGSGSIVGAGAVVDRDVEPGTVVVGVPARPKVGHLSS